MPAGVNQYIGSLEAKVYPSNKERVYGLVHQNPLVSYLQSSAREMFGHSRSRS